MALVIGNTSQSEETQLVETRNNEMFIIMTIDECGSEVRISNYDKNRRGFENEADAYKALDDARTDYEEYRHFWVENADTAYKEVEQYVNDNDYEQHFDELEREEMMAEREWAASDY